MAFDARIELVKGVKSTLEFTKEQVNNISTLIDKYEGQLKQGDTEYASKALHLLNNISDNIIQEPMYQVFNTLFKFYGKYTYGGASNQLDGLGDNLTVESLELSNKNLKELPEALDKAISQVDNILNQIENKYKGLFGKDIEKRPNSKVAKSCDEIQKWLDYSIEHNELNNDRIGYSTVEIDERQMHFKTGTLINPQHNTVDIYI